MATFIGNFLAAHSLFREFLVKWFSMSRFVDPLDLTLVLPMQLGRTPGPKHQSPRDQVFLLNEALSKNGWDRLDTLSRGDPESDNGFIYAEMAYFHPHVRRFLYGEKALDPEAEIKLYQLATLDPVRAGKASVDAPGHVGADEVPGEIQIDSKGSKTRFSVRAAWLHHVEPDTVLMSVHLSAKGPVLWRNALDAISLLRTVSFQHYQRNKDDHGAELDAWIGGDEEFLNQLHFATARDSQSVPNRAKEMLQAIDTRTLLPISVWNELLEPLCAEGLKLDILGDHRAAMMVFAGVHDPEKITDDEWFALAQADPAGYTTYAASFREDELRKAAYDRWWDKQKPDKRHRYLAGPMTFLSVMHWPQEPRSEYFERMRKTWRRQQFQIFMLAHYQRAALLILEDRIARLAAGADSPSGIERLQGDIARFSSGHWFPEISPQIQGQELYQLLRRHLCLDTLYQSVIEDKSLLGNWLEAREAIERDRLWNNINRRYLPAVLLVTALGATIVTEPMKAMVLPWFCETGFSKDIQSLLAGLVVFVVLSLIVLPLWKLTRWLGEKR